MGGRNAGSKWSLLELWHEMDLLGKPNFAILFFTFLFFTFYLLSKELVSKKISSYLFGLKGLIVEIALTVL